MNTQCTISVRHYPANYEVTVSSSEENVFAGRIAISTDGYDAEDLTEVKESVETLKNLETVEEVEGWLEDHYACWGAISCDAR